MSAAALLEFTSLNPQEAKIVRSFGIAGRAAELVAATGVEQETGQIERVGRPLQQGSGGSLSLAHCCSVIGSWLLARLR